MTLRELPPGNHGLVSARPDPDLEAAGYETVEYVVSGRATSYRCQDDASRVVPLPDGEFDLVPADAAEYATRVVVRRPIVDGPTSFSGTLLVEWLNVSSGMEASPDWTFGADEIVRAGHAWAGVSAQYVGVEGGAASVSVADVAPPAGIKGSDPDRYGGLSHPGDAFAYDIYTQVAVAVRDEVGADRVLAIGESQSGATLTTYANGVQPVEGVFDGVLIHSRPGVAAPLGEAGAGLHMDAVLRSHPVRIRGDLDVPVLMIQTEGDLFDRIDYLPARQPDSDRLRLWEVAGSAHADKYTIGDFEELLGSPVPVNRGQQWAVVRAGVRALERWVRVGDPPPSADRLAVDGDDFVRDEHGLVRGGVRSPVVDAPAAVVSGRPWPDAPPAARLFGSTTPLARPAFTDQAAYRAAYESATDTMISAGFACAEDREQLLSEASG